MATERESFDKLFRQTYSKLFFYARSIVGNDSDADDVVSDVFYELWKRIGEVQLGGRIEGFLYRAVYTRSLNLLRHNGASSTRIAALDDINARRMELIDNGSNPHHDMENEDLRRILDTAIGELPEKCAAVFRMSYIDGMKNEEIARRQGLSVRTIEAHMYHALKYLRARLGDLTFFAIFSLLSAKCLQAPACYWFG